MDLREEQLSTQRYLLVLDKIEDKTLTLEEFNNYILNSWNISEAHPKGVSERVARITRRTRMGPKTGLKRNLRDKITPKYKTSRTGSSRYDPRRTSRGKKAADKKGRENDFKEAIEFIAKNQGKSLQEAKEDLRKVNDKPRLRSLVSRLLLIESKNSNWFYDIVRVLDTING